jgi:DNA primase
MNEGYVLEVLRTSLGAHTRMDNTGNAQFYCPSCRHRKQKLAVNVRSLKYHCWICEERGNNIANFLWKNGYKNEARKLGASKNKKTDLENLFGDDIVIDYGEEQKVELPPKYHNLFVNKHKVMFLSAVNYLYQRGLTDDDFIKYKIHYSIMDERVLFPSYDDNENLNYYVSRSIDPECTYKYRNSDNPKTEIIFNEYMIKWNEPLYLVEGVFDYIACGKNAVPILGSTLTSNSKLYKRLVKNQTPVVFAFDYDANKKMFKSIENIVKYNDHVSYIDWGSETRDISEMGTDDFSRFVKDHQVNYDTTSQILSKLII